MKNIRYEPSTRLTQRWHKKELEILEKGVKKHKLANKSEFIRMKALS